jgi:DNA polymerase III delta prime subunit
MVLTKFHNMQCGCNGCVEVKYNLKTMNLTPEEYIEKYTVDIYEMNSIQDINKKLDEVFKNVFLRYYKSLTYKQRQNPMILLDMKLSLKEDEKEYKKLLYKQYYNLWWVIQELDNDNLRYDPNVDT